MECPAEPGSDPLRSHVSEGFCQVVTIWPLSGLRAVEARRFSADLDEAGALVSGEQEVPAAGPSQQVISDAGLNSRADPLSAVSKWADGLRALCQHIFTVPKLCGTIVIQYENTAG